MLRKAFVFALTASCLAACSAANEAPAPSPGEEEVVNVDETTESVHGDTFTYYIVTRQDLRKCMYPVCGGWFVKRVNKVLTKCADGGWQKDCHAVDVDLSALGVDADTEYQFEHEIFGNGFGLVRGHLQKQGNADVLVASEAWVGGAKQKPFGTFYRAAYNGVTCITWPCPSFTEAKLNAYQSASIHDVDLFASGAPVSAIDQGYEQLFGKGTLIAGWHYSFWGPAGKGKGLAASEFYVPLQASQKYCATTTIAGESPVFYAKNFSSEKEAWGWLDATFPNGENSQVIEGACDQPKACIKLYAPVCGVVKDGPENTYGNWCEFEGAVMADAGSDGESKGFYSKGECGAAPVCDYDDPSRSWVSQDAEQCKAIKFFCADGQQPFFDECGCGCEIAPPPEGEKCGNTTCKAGLVCCNASCGICTEPGMSCIQIACE